MMRRTFWLACAVLIVLCAADDAGAVITATANHCKTSLSSGSYSQVNCDMPGSVSSGNFVAVCVYWSDATEGHLTSLTDSASNTWTLRASTYGTNDSQSFKMGDSNITAAGTISILAHFSPNVSNASITAQEFTNVTSSSPFDQSAVASTDGTGTGTDAATTGATGTRTQANEVLVGCIVTTNAAPTVTAGTGYTETDNITPWTHQMQYKVVSAAGTDASTWTFGSGTTNYIANIATYKDTVAGGGGGGQRPLFPLFLSWIKSLFLPHEVYACSTHC